MPIEDAYLKVLESKLNQAYGGAVRFEVMNAGLEGTGLDYYYHFLLSSAQRLEPDLVLLGITLNDIAVYTDENDAAAASLPPHYDNGRHPLSEWLVTHSQFCLWAFMNAKSIMYKVGILNINKTHSYDFVPLLPPSKEQGEAWGSAFRMLDKIVALARERHYRLIAVVFPEEVQLSLRALDLYRRQLGVALGDEALSGEPQRRLAEFLRSRDVTLIDPLPDFRLADRGQLFLRNRAITFDQVHPSVEGHHLLADVIFRSLGKAALPSPPTSCEKAGAPAPHGR